MSFESETRDARARLGALLRHGAADEGVSASTIEEQLQTAAALRSRLDAFGGAILGDEVGAGKTYVAMALLVDALAQEPRKGALILVPKPALLAKWKADLRLYIQAALSDHPRLARRLFDSISVLDRGLEPQKKTAIAIGQHTLFMGRVGVWDCAAVLRAYMRKRSKRNRMHYRPWLRACGITGEPATEPDWCSAWASAEVFDAYPDALAPLDEHWGRYDSNQGVDPSAVRRAIGEVRRLVARRHLPNPALLVIDEAHHLRNVNTTRYSTMMEVVDGGFDAMLFLTATPFQMGPEELRSVVEFSKGARGSRHNGTSQDFDTQVGRMVQAMYAHVDALQAFGDAWGDLSQDEADLAQHLLEDSRARATAAPHVIDVVQLFEKALGTKASVEEALDPFLVRSVRPHFRDPRAGLLEGTEIDPSSRIPLALVDRMLYEIFEQKDRTFVASALLGACSSWDALYNSAVMANPRRAGASSRGQLFRLRGQLGSHPKFESTVAAVLRASAQGEKALVFVGRHETGIALRDRLAAELSNDDATESELTRSRRVLQDRDRLGWPALRENYLHTIYPLVFGEPKFDDLDRLVDENLELFQSADTFSGKSGRDYSIEKRFWEHVLFKAAAEKHRGWRKSLADETLAESTSRILDDQYVLNGLDLTFGDERAARVASPSARTERRPQMEFASAFVSYPSPWARFRDELAGVPPDHRAGFVDDVARAIGLSHLRFEFLDLDFEGSAERLFANMLTLVERADWAYRFDSLVDQVRQATKQTSDETQLNPVAERMDRLRGGLRSSNRVQYVHGGTDGGTSANAIAGFNTPMYPDVLISTDVLGEGIDLHRHCRHVIHHDLPWNPATLEQRTGRVDRIGSLSEHLRESGSDPSAYEILVDMPYVPGTYDAFIYARVTERERVFRWLLGYRPEWEKEQVDADEPAPAIPDGWADELRINLSPLNPSAS